MPLLSSSLSQHITAGAWRLENQSESQNEHDLSHILAADAHAASEQIRIPGDPTLLFRGRPYSIDISSSMDQLARILFGLAAGIFLLAPMFALSYIRNKEYCLIVTCLFVVVFVLVVSCATTATNQELMTVTAAYAAVLVVFVGQSSET